MEKPLQSNISLFRLQHLLIIDCILKPLHCFASWYLPNISVPLSQSFSVYFN